MGATADATTTTAAGRAHASAMTTPGMRSRNTATRLLTPAHRGPVTRTVVTGGRRASGATRGRCRRCSCGAAAFTGPCPYRRQRRARSACADGSSRVSTVAPSASITSTAAVIVDSTTSSELNSSASARSPDCTAVELNSARARAKSPVPDRRPHRRKPGEHGLQVAHLAKQGGQVGWLRAPRQRDDGVRDPEPVEIDEQPLPNLAADGMLRCDERIDRGQIGRHRHHRAQRADQLVVQCFRVGTWRAAPTSGTVGAPESALTSAARRCAFAMAPPRADPVRSALLSTTSVGKPSA